MYSLFFDFAIEGVDMYHLLAWFFVYSFFGWIWETAYVSVKSRKFVNRGFVFGPCLTIYGSGAVMIYMILMRFDGNYGLLFFLGMIVATVLEYVTAVIMEGMFHTSWWDYSNSFCNFQGRICLFSSLFWGFLTVLLFKYLQPFVAGLVERIPREFGQPLLMAVIAVYMVDFVIACVGASNIAGKLQQMNEVLDDFGDYLKNTQLAAAAGVAKRRAEGYRFMLSEKAARKRLERNHESLMDYIGKNPELAELKETAEERFAEFKEKYLGTHKNMKRYERRILRNYPHLGRGSAARKIKKNRKMEERQKRSEKKQNS